MKDEFLHSLARILPYLVLTKTPYGESFPYSLWRVSENLVRLEGKESWRRLDHVEGWVCLFFLPITKVFTLHIPLLSFKQGEGSFGIVWERLLLMAYSRAPHGVPEGVEASFCWCTQVRKRIPWMLPLMSFANRSAQRKAASSHPISCTLSTSTTHRKSPNHSSPQIMSHSPRICQCSFLISS